MTLAPVAIALSGAGILAMAFLAVTFLRDPVDGLAFLATGQGG